MRTRALVAASAVLAGALGACGGGGGDRLDVFAASSLVNAFPAYAERFHGPSPAFSFAGSDQLAAQIRQGVAPDVFASADTSYPAALHRAGLVAKPVDFATNKLVIAVPRGSSVRSVASLGRPGTRIAIGTRSVPAGAYAREVLARVPAPTRRRILANVADREPSVEGIVAKLAEGAVDAGLVYATDVKAASGDLRGIPLPPRLRPKVTYAAAVVAGSSHAGAARRFVAGLRRGPGRRALGAAGFGPPPRG